MLDWRSVLSQAYPRGWSHAKAPRRRPLEAVGYVRSNSWAMFSYHASSTHSLRILLQTVQRFPVPAQGVPLTRVSLSLTRTSSPCGALPTSHFSRSTSVRTSTQLLQTPPMSSA
ncbi:hypothetical protein FOMPIDRAFT_95980, partial [Fomitopsis schrenkii]